MEVWNDDTVKVGSQTGPWVVAADEAEVRKPSLVVEAHVHSAVQHDPFTPDWDEQTGSTNILTGTQRGHCNRCHWSCSGRGCFLSLQNQDFQDKFFFKCTRKNYLQLFSRQNPDIVRDEETSSSSSTSSFSISTGCRSWTGRSGIFFLFLSGVKRKLH